MLKKAGIRFLVCLVALGALIAAPAQAAKRKHDAITPGAYTTAPIPGAESLRGFLYRFHVFSHDKKPLRSKGHKYWLQSVAFFKWTQESTLPADGVVHWCGFGVTFVSPPGLPNHTPGGVFEGSQDEPLYNTDVATGRPTDWPTNAPGPITHSSFHGKFNEKKHRIRITGTCAGVTTTRTYKLTKRF